MEKFQWKCNTAYKCNDSLVLIKKTFKNYFYTGRYVSVLRPNKWTPFVTKQAFVYLGFTIFVSKDKGLFSLINSFLAFGIGEV